MSPSRRSLSPNVAPLPPREGTPEADFPTQECPLHFSRDTLLVWIPQKNLRKLLDLVEELNLVALRQEIVLTGIATGTPLCHHGQGRMPDKTTPPTPTPDAHPDPEVHVLGGSFCWSPMRRCYTRRSSSRKSQANQSSPRCEPIPKARSPPRRAETPPARREVAESSEGVHSQGSSPAITGAMGTTLMDAKG